MLKTRLAAGGLVLVALLLLTVVGGATVVIPLAALVLTGLVAVGIYHGVSAFVDRHMRPLDTDRVTDTAHASR